VVIGSPSALNFADSMRYGDREVLMLT